MTKPIWRAMLKDFGGLDLTELIEVSRAVIARSGSDVAISSQEGKNK
jgi:hypothetical protein